MNLCILGRPDLTGVASDSTALVRSGGGGGETTTWPLTSRVVISNRSSFSVSPYLIGSELCMENKKEDVRAGGIAGVSFLID